MNTEVNHTDTVNLKIQTHSELPDQKQRKLSEKITDQIKMKTKLVATYINKITGKTAQVFKESQEINQEDENKEYNIKELLYPQETESVVEGTILKDLTQRSWRIGEPIGKGSFGRIFLASDKIEESVSSSNARYVVKIEPHTNGPLFVEIHCLLNTGKATKNAPIPTGMLNYIASGSHYFGKTEYRFLILPRYKCDLHSLIKNRCVNPNKY